MYTDKITNFKELSEIWYRNHSVGVSYSYQRDLLFKINHLNKFIGDLPINQIKPYHIDDIIISLAKRNPNTNKPMARKSLQEIVHTANRIFEFAIDNDLIIKNPAKNSGKAVPKNSPKKVVSAISKDEQFMILYTPHRCQIAAIIMMLTGLRVGELLALEWSDIDFENKRLYVKQHAVKVASNRFEIQPGTKNGKNRYVTIPENLIDFLERSKLNAKSDLVFPKTDNKLNTPSSWKSAWESYMNTLNWNHSGYKGSKFDPKGYPKFIKINPHQLRHTYATLLYKSGVDVKTASKLLGHSTVQLTLDIYTHLDEEHKTLDISKFNDFLSKDLM